MVTGRDSVSSDLSSYVVKDNANPSDKVKQNGLPQVCVTEGDGVVIEERLLVCIMLCIPDLYASAAIR